MQQIKRVILQFVIYLQENLYKMHKTQFQFYTTFCHDSLMYIQKCTWVGNNQESKWMVGVGKGKLDGNELKKSGKTFLYCDTITHLDDCFSAPAWV